MIIYATHNVLTREDCKFGYKLLQCIRSYLVVDMYMALEVHTKDTIAAGRAAVSTFGNKLQVIQ